MVQRERERVHESRRLDRACEHVNNLWFPVNEPLLAKIKRAARSGDFDSDVTTLVREIRGDFSLFVYCLKELAYLLRQEGVPVPHKPNPCELLEWAGVVRLKKILSKDTNQISRHSLDDMNEFQKMRLEEAMVSASSSQVFFKELGLDEDLAYSTALFRQLGYALIAWNYAQSYQRAITSLKTGDNLDFALTQILGFSPSLLGYAVMSEWGLPRAVLNAVGETDYAGLPLEDTDFETAAITKTLTRICKISEALARANNPDHYPSARKDWDTAIEEVESILGPSGLQAIAAKVEENAKAYTVFIPDIFKGAFAFDPEVRINTMLRPAVHSNPFLEQCDNPLRSLLSDLYSMIANNVATGECLKTLVRQIIPEAGFSRGCVYTIDPTLGLLIPQLEIGTRGAFKPVKYDKNEEEHTNLALQAFQTSKVVTGALNSDPDNPVTCMARSIGFSQRMGVLYLEQKEMLFNALEKNARTHFNAIAYALDDCLKLV